MRTTIGGIILCSACLGCGVSPGGSDASRDVTCTEGMARCNELAYQHCEERKWVTTQTCEGSCDAQLGCVACTPFTGTCEGNVATTCKADGSGTEVLECDAELGLRCSDGRCQGACASADLAKSYIGCEYFPTVTANSVNPEFDFSVVVSNAGTQPAEIVVRGGALTEPLRFTVPAQDLSTQALPWVANLKMCYTLDKPFQCTALDPVVVNHVASGAYHLKSTQPVTLYQFNPKDYAKGDTLSYTNDASLLLPANALRGDYVVAAFPSSETSFGYPGFISVTAVRDNTIVTINAKAPSAGTPVFPVGIPTSITMQSGDVVQIPATEGDLTGSTVQADQPVQVLSGHYCANIPVGVRACDHLEESLFPIETLSTDYLVTAPAVPSIPQGKEQFIRIVAVEGNTALTYDPPLPSAPSSIANPGGFVQLERQSGDYKISADKKILIAQFMEGQDAGGDTGDPSMTLAVALDQYRKHYLFHAPANYETNYVNITAITGANVLLDGSSVEQWTAIGTSGYSVARVLLEGGNADDGNHEASSSTPFGISVYGYGRATSYWYPGGLNLDAITID